MSVDRLRALVRDVPDFPKPGILFRDICPLLRDADGLRDTVEALAAPWKGAGIDQVAGIEARGFVLAPAVALALGAGFLPVRKQGKLPGETVGRDYDLEYGTATIELPSDAVQPNDSVLVLDDVLATGGTARAAVDLIEGLGGRVAGLSFLIELTALDGRRRLSGHRIESLIDY
jgi:adenine phosphoribosyltransferase